MSFANTLRSSIRLPSPSNDPADSAPLPIFGAGNRIEMEDRLMVMANRSSDVTGSPGNGRKFSRSSLGEFKPAGRKLVKAKPAPPDQTNAENFYYLKQMNSKTPMVIIMTDGEEIRGWIEWYDRSCLKVNREGAPNLLIQKHCIKYLYKEEDL